MRANWALVFITVLLPVMARAVPEKSGDEDTVTAICASERPVLVIDNFSGAADNAEVSELKPNMDIDGDGVPDVGHGEIVAALLRASGKSVVTYNMEDDSTIEGVTKILTGVAEGVEAGKLKVSAVNFSHTVEIENSALRRDLRISYQPDQYDPHRAEIAAIIDAHMKERDSDSFGELLAVSRRLGELGVPLILAAGNEGADHVNLLGFLPNAYSVGSLGLDGGKSVTSVDNSLVKIWRTGEFVSRRAQDGGVDLNGDGVADIAPSLLSGGANIGLKFARRPLAELLRETPSGGDFDLLSRETPSGLERLTQETPDMIYRAQDLVKFYRIEKRAFAKALEKRGAYFDKTLHFGFSVDAAGELVFDPAHDGTANQLMLVAGTSFAAPSICAGHVKVAAR